MSKKKPVVKMSKGSKTEQPKAKSEKAKHGKADLPKRRNAGFYLKWFIALGIWGMVALCAIILWFGWDLPRPTEVAKATTRQPTLTLVAADNSILYQKGGVHGQPVVLEELPPYVVQAFVATEDRRFYDHFGIDLVGFLRAMVINVTSGSFRQGGSGITQQLAKNLFLSRQKTIRRKVQELLLAFWLEYTYSKDEILEIYLNRIYLGAGVYGIDAAARVYFGVPASQVSLYQAAVLAGLPKAPSAYNPRANAEKSATRANLVLDLMAREGYLQKQEADYQKQTQVRVVQKSAGQNSRYFADWIVGRVGHMVGPMQDDLIVQTGYEPSHQRLLEKNIWKILKQTAPNNGSQIAAVLMREDGTVTAMLGGKNWSKSPFNRAVHAKRQTGSVFKPIAYLAAMEEGLEAQDFIDISDIEIEGWSPRDQSIKQGEILTSVSLKDGLARSLNKAAVAVAEKAGRENVINMARRMGITAPLEPIASLPLGVMEISLLEMTGAYATIARQGRAAVPHGIKQIGNGNGALLFSHFDDATELFSSDIARQMENMLQAVIEDGTGKRAALNRVAAGKTGTTQQNKDAWFIGYTRLENKPGEALILGVWIGNDKATAMKNISGGGYPAIYWQRVMSEIR